MDPSTSNKNETIIIIIFAIASGIKVDSSQKHEGSTRIDSREQGTYA